MTIDQYHEKLVVKEALEDYLRKIKSSIEYLTKVGDVDTLQRQELRLRNAQRVRDRVTDDL